MFSTEVYTRQVDALEGHGAGGEGYLDLAPEQSRSVTDRPFVGPHVVPQRQLSQLPDEDIKEVCFKFDSELVYIPGPGIVWANWYRNSLLHSEHSGIEITT